MLCYREHNCNIGTRCHSYFWGDWVSSFVKNIRASGLSFHVPVGERTELTSLTRSIVRRRRQLISRSTYKPDVQGWLNVVDTLLFLVRSGVGRILHHWSQAVPFCAQTLVLKFKRLDFLPQRSLLHLGKTGFFLVILLTSLHVVTAWIQLVSLRCEIIDSREEHLHL